MNNLHIFIHWNAMKLAHIDISQEFIHFKCNTIWSVHYNLFLYPMMISKHWVNIWIGIKMHSVIIQINQQGQNMTLVVNGLTWLHTGYINISNWFNVMHIHGMGLLHDSINAIWIWVDLMGLWPLYHPNASLPGLRRYGRYRHDL